MCKIFKFKPREEGRETGYSYFAKAVLDSLCEKNEDSGDYEMYIEDPMGNFYKVDSAYISGDEKYISIRMGKSLSGRQI